MRRVEKTRNRPWLRYVEPRKGDAWPASSLKSKGAGSSNADYLVHDMGLYLELEANADALYLRVYSTPISEARGMPFGAASYSGTDLGDMLVAAIYDWSMLRNGDAVASWSSKEIVKWIPL